MNPEQIFAHFKRAASSFTVRQMVTLAVVFVAVVGVIIGSTYWMKQTSYTLLYSELDPESAAAVTTRLKAQKIDYQLDDDGRTIRVPSDRIDETRLDLASQGLPSSGRIGFEVFDRTAFGTTEFLEQVNFRRALEGELARTISTMTEVASARVHIAMARPTLFTGEGEQSKASVVLKLRNQRPLSPAGIAGIAGLIAASVEGLRPESVVIMDTFGRPLSQQPDTGDTAGAPLDRQQGIERDLTTKVVALLEPIVGAGHVRVNVSAKLNANSSEQTEERWDPTTVVRSQQTSNDATNSGGGTGGIAGTRANAPPGNEQMRPTPPLVVPPTVNGRSSTTTNFEVGRLTRHTVNPRGEVTRLSVAVLLDDQRITKPGENGGQSQTEVKPRDAKELERIRGLVAAAVGFDNERGDQLTVENITFDEIPMEETAPRWWQPTVQQVGFYVPEAFRLGFMALVAVLGFTMVLRPMVRSAFPAGFLPPPQVVELPPAPPKTVEDLEGEIEAELDARAPPKSIEARRLPVLTKRIAKKAETEPEMVARLVRTWLAEEER